MRAIGLTLLLASVFIFWRAFCTPELTKSAWDHAEPTAIPRTITNARFTRGLDEFASILKRPLGAPLYDPPAPVRPAPKQIQRPKKKVVKTEPKPQPKKRNRRAAAAGLRLIGTMLERGRSVAIIVDSEGDFQVPAEGDSIETPAGVGQVESIDQNEVIVAFDDDTLTLKMP